MLSVMCVCIYNAMFDNVEVSLGRHVYYLKINLSSTKVGYLSRGTIQLTILFMGSFVLANTWGGGTTPRTLPTVIAKLFFLETCKVAWTCSNMLFTVSNH